MTDSLKTMWEGVRVREKEEEVVIFSIKVGEEEDLSSQPRNYRGMLIKLMDEFKFNIDLEKDG